MPAMMTTAQPTVIFKTDCPIMYPPEIGFRADSPGFAYDVAFMFINGGMGDYICWARAIQWIAQNIPWIHGTVVALDYMHELLDYWLKDFPEWKIINYETFINTAREGLPMKGPTMQQFMGMNASGAHLLDCGFTYYAHRPVPAGERYYAKLEQEKLDQHLPPKIRNLIKSGKKYACLTLDAIQENRCVPGLYWEPVVQHIKSLGLVPVLIGKSQVVTIENAPPMHSIYDGMLDTEGCLNMRNQTTLIEAAATISKAEFIVGMDNGLLHLAGCTETPIVFGHNVAKKEYRIPLRPYLDSDRVFNVALDKSELACIGCQSNMNLLVGFNFKNCFYKDNKCIDLLFANGAKKWIDQIDLAIKK